MRPLALLLGGVLVGCGGEVLPSPPSDAGPDGLSASCDIPLGTPCDPQTWTEVCCGGTETHICHASYPWVQRIVDPCSADQ